MEVTLTPLRLNGRDVMLSVWHDITERKAVEDALRLAKNAAESANKTKSEFVTRMNHELRTPLTAIIGFARTLLRERSGPMADTERVYVERIRENGMHLLSVITQILAVARVEAGRMDLDRQPVHNSDVVRETVTRTVPSINFPGATAFHNALDENLMAALTKAKTAEQAMADTATEWQKITRRTGEDKIMAAVKASKAAWPTVLDPV